LKKLEDKMSKTIPEEPMLSKMPINCGSCNRMIQMYKAEKTDFHTWNTIKSPGSTKTGFMRRIMSEEKVKRDVSKIYKSDANISITIVIILVLKTKT